MYVSDATAGKIDVFEAEGAGAPTVDRVYAEDVTSSSARLVAKIDPRGAATSYAFVYGTGDCAQNPSSCTEVKGASAVPAGFSDQLVDVEASGLAPGTLYHFEVLAVNEHGHAQGGESFGSLSTLPSPQGMLDGRAWELVSPANKDGSSILPFQREGGLIQAAQDGASITFVANGPTEATAQANRAPYPVQVLSTRTPEGWSSEQIVTPRTAGEGFDPGAPQEYRVFSEDLSAGLVQPDGEAGEPFEDPPLVAGIGEQLGGEEKTERTMYVRSSSTGGYQPLVTAANDQAVPRTHFGEALTFAGASPDLAHVVFESSVALTAGGAPGLYEWQAGSSLVPVSALPNGRPAQAPVLGYEGSNVRDAVSEDGSRVIWSGESELPNPEGGETVDHLYLTDTSTGQTLQLDAATDGLPEAGEEEGEVGYQAASTSANRVFFTDTARLTGESRLEPVPGTPFNPADLYECEIREQNGKLACALTDLTVDEDPGESADVLNVIPGVSDDGSYVYFVANGVLAPGASHGECVKSELETAPAGATCNLYEYHEGQITFIGALSNEDAGDWGSLEGPSARDQDVEPRPDLADVSARVSPDGQYLAFMSNQPLTGYDNTDSNPQAGGARDEEVYLYDAAAKTLQCASCAQGRPSTGVQDVQDSGEGLGLLVDRREDWLGHYLAGSVPGWAPISIQGGYAYHQPRYLLDDGRLFFDSPDDLVPAAGNGKNDVYEYEPQGVGTCSEPDGCVALISSGVSAQESAFLDASESGDDAFFLTAEPLVGIDQDTDFDLYDARVCTTSSPCLSQDLPARESCQSSAACNTAPASVPLETGPSGSATYQGPGNAAKHEALATTKHTTPKPLTRAQKLALALKACRKHKAGSKRVRCERKARNAYGPKHAQKSKAESAARRRNPRRRASDEHGRRRNPRRRASDEHGRGRIGG